jgi:hypothetical protein
MNSSDLLEIVLIYFIILINHSILTLKQVLTNSFYII